MKPVSGKRLAAILRRRGWDHVRTVGSHFTYRSPDGRVQVVVPIHGNKDLRTGTQATLMKQAGLTDDDL